MNETEQQGKMTVTTRATATSATEVREVLVEVEGEEAIAAELSKLPKMNWGALFMPAIWGPAHGSWITILFYPIWIFADNCLVAGVQFGGLAIVGSVIVFLGTAALMIFYGLTAGQRAYLRVAHKMTMETYLKRERIWTVVSLAIALVFIAFATWYNLTIVLPAGSSL